MKVKVRHCFKCKFPIYVESTYPNNIDAYCDGCFQAWVVVLRANRKLSDKSN